jgi:hypothetical protein
MGLIDAGQHIIVELSGVLVFVAGIFGLGSASGLVPIEGITLSLLNSYIAILLGLYLMGYRKLPEKIVGTVDRLRK